MSSIFGVPTDGMQAFDAIYVAAQPPAVQTVLNMPIGSAAANIARMQAAAQLAQQGYPVDVNIVAYGWDPWLAMYQRVVADGLAWGPSGFQATPNPPSVMQSGPVPAGAIKFSINTADYPPYVVAPAVPPPTSSPIGPDLGAVDPSTGKEMFAASATDPQPAGTPWEDATGKYIKVALGSELMDPKHKVMVWEKQ